jgi:sulfur-carrier protein adenylyltransferase/sulfurtransferase
MNRKYVFLAGLLILLGVGLAVLPLQQHHDTIDPVQLLSEIKDQTRFLSTDEIAKKIIEKDPSYMYVDVREPAEYNSFSLPGAVNVPLTHLLDPENETLLNQKVKNVVFFSNGDISAEKAWLLCRRMGFKHQYIMRGGLNYWIETIMNPQVPPLSAPSQEFDTYQFRKGASAYFGGGPADASSKESTTKQKVVVKPRSGSAPAAGGC